ncbi:hypothetical protein DFH08DRAFT_1022764 [Mycena albidolilacea]|uniref:Uncharacterized protein n=1 Tax=Mycena albidolilacea TaxID=1033008 RepID=A0AAD7EJX7_9AGAR|nr:hypothetical protein DFH08DRAFT_1022764 [Mycena albidolilacea]
MPAICVKKLGRPGGLAFEALGTLLTARTAFIEQADYSIPDWVNVVDLQTAEGTEERAAWSAHITAVTDVIEGKKTIPEPPGVAPATVDPKRKRGKAKQVTLTRVPTEKQLQHEKIRAQRILDLEGAAPAGDVGPSRGKTAGRRRDTLADDLVIVEGEENKKGELSEAVYCIACDTRAQFRNPQRIKEHAVTCAKLAEIFPKLYQKVVVECAERGRGDGKTLKLRTKTKLSAAAPAPAADAKSDQGVEMEVDTSVNDSGTSAKPSIKEYYTPVKMTPARQAMLDLALFQLVICAALPFTFVDNPWLINFLLIAIPNYVTPERTAFFIRHITEQLSVFTTELQSFLHNRVYLTLSFDGWSSLRSTIRQSA